MNNSRTAPIQTITRPTTTAAKSKRLISPTESPTENDPGTSKKVKTTEKVSEEEQMLCDEILATCVMKQPMLYNPKLKSHRFSGMNAEKWRLIGERISEDCPNVDTNIAKVKDRWIKIRDDFLKRQRLNKKPTGSGRSETDDIDDGPLDELLSGLNDVYDHKQTASNIKYPEQGSEKEYHATNPNEIKNQSAKFQRDALQLIEANSDKFLSVIEGFKDSFLKGNNKENVVIQDKAAKFCDLLQMQLRDLDDHSFLDAQIQILQVISNLRK